MLKKILSITFVSFIFTFTIIFFIPKDKTYKVIEIASPTKIILENKTFRYHNFESFDDKFSEKNSRIASSLNISKEEAFILGNLSKYWASNLIKGRNVYIKNNDLIFNKNSYRTKFLYSGFCLIDSKPFNQKAFSRKIYEIKRANYKVLDLDSEIVYELNDPKVKTLTNFLVIRKSHLNKTLEKKLTPPIITLDNIKILLSDSTTKWKPDRYCSSIICKEILENINNAESTIDMAIYGYSKTYAIEDALKKAIKRGVKIRLVLDSDINGNNIYSDTNDLKFLIPNNISDKNSPEVQNIMHNKFYIFDNKILITGSANLSHTDMSGYNSNSIIVIQSPKLANIYKQEFEQMYAGKFHNNKESSRHHKLTVDGKELQVYFSPQDKSLTKAIIPLIQKATNYIYIPTFVLTERRVTEELIKAKQRGVDVKIIIDALNASIKHSKHNELRAGGLLVKTENYAGKMHSKSIIIDDEYTVIGSMNFSNSGENKNDENIIVIKSPEIAKFYKDFFIYQWNKIDNKWLKTNVRAEGKDSFGSCFDGIDNNYDGLKDTEDPACK